MPETFYPTISQDTETEEDLLTAPQEEFSAPVNPQDIEGYRSFPSAPINPQDIPVARRREFLAQPVMSDAEAGQTYERLPFMGDQEKTEAMARLARYTGDLDDRDDKFHASERAYEFTNPNARAAWLDQPDVRSNLGYLEDANAAFDRMAVKKFLETTVLKRPLNSDAEYEAERNNFIGRIMAGKPKVSDTEAFQTVKVAVEREQEMNVVTTAAANLMLQKYVLGAITGKGVRVGDVYNDVATKNGEMVNGYEGQLYNGLESIKLDFDAKLGRHLGAIGVFGNFMQKDMAGTATLEDKKAAQEAFLSIDEKDQGDLMALIAQGLDAGGEEAEAYKRAWHDLKKFVLDPFGAVTMIKQQVGTGRDFEYIEAIARLKEGKEARISSDGSIVFPTPEELQKFPGAYRKLTKEETSTGIKEYETLSKLNAINRRFEGVKEATYNRYQGMFSKDFLWGLPKAVELGAYGFQAQIAPMAFAMTGGQAGKLLYTAAVAPAYYEQWMRESPTASKSVAMTGSILGAYAESWLEGFQGLSAVGQSVFKKYLLTLRNGGAKAFMKLTLGGFAEQMIEEGTQNAATMLARRMTQDVATAIDPNVDPGKVQNAQEMWEDWKSQLGPTAAMMIWPAISGAGIGTYRHLKDPARQVYNEDTLRRWGISQEKINAILGESNWDKRNALFVEATAARSKQDIAEGMAYSVEQDRNAQQEEETQPKVTLAAVTTPEGERRFNVVDPEGNVVVENLPAEEALKEVASLQELVDLERLHQEAQANVGELETQKQAEAETLWEALKPEQKVTAENILEFSYAGETPEQQVKLAQLQAALDKRSKRIGGKRDEVEFVDVDVPSTRAGRSAVDFINWFQGTFGKRVQFVNSKSDQPLSFGGITLPSDPNTIFLDVKGNRNILSLLGHEWSHTLEHSNPKLWADVASKLKPLVVDWAKEMGKIGPNYTADQATPEFIANVIGDAFGDASFWELVRSRDKSMFRRMVAAVIKWFDVITDRASEWGTNAPDVIKDLDAMRNIVADAIEQAMEGPETIAEAVAEYEEGLHGEVVAGGQVSARRERQAQFSLRRESDIPLQQPARKAASRRKGKPQVTVTAFDPALMGFAERPMTPTPFLLDQLKKEVKAYNDLLRCLQ